MSFSFSLATWSCYYCDFKTDDWREYQYHAITQHKGKPAYPGQADIELYGLKPQGTWWEKPVDKREDVMRYAERKEKEKKKNKRKSI